MHTASARADAEKPVDLPTGPDRYDIGFLLLPGFSFISFANAVEPLRMANKVLRRDFFRYRFHSVDGADVTGSNGARLRVESPIGADPKPDLLIICSSDGIEKFDMPTAMRQVLRRMARMGVRMAGVCTGAYVLGELGLLDGRRCTIHWEYSEIFRESVPKAELRSSLFEEDRQFVTSAVGTASFDMMMHLMEPLCGATVKLKVAEIAIQGDLRSANQDQRSGVTSRLRMRSKALARCVELMDGNLDEPLSLDEIAGEVGLSRRQVERLFGKILGIAPMAYYRQKRLDLARRLLESSDVPVVDIAIATGFVSASHFSRAYRGQFGVNPAHHRFGLP